MRPILYYLRTYLSTLNLKVALPITLFTALMVWLNYTAGIDSAITSLDNRIYRFAAYLLLFTLIFGGSWLLTFLCEPDKLPLTAPFYVLMLFSAALFALKMSIQAVPDSLQNALANPSFQYWRLVLHWPVKTVLVLCLVFVVWKLFRFEAPVSGMMRPVQGFKPYYLMLAIMMPLLVIASLSPSFQQLYPRVKSILPHLQESTLLIPYALAYELAYGLDFLTIEVFFRGFLVLAFARYAGTHAILPMAAFYCAVHFGKPLFECISSFFGALVLGAVVYNTRSIWGGLIVHLGIAWVMEILGIAFRLF